jgi:dTDP-4-amino-4,6-dideoxygalactose transaminase
MASPRLPDPAVLLPRFEKIVSSGHLTKGPELDGFERECAEYLGVQHCVGVSSCTSGLMLVFQALRRGPAAGVRRPRIAVPSFTFMASISAMVWAGFEPEFVDVDEASMNLCLADLETALKEPDVVAALGVHCFGNPVPTARAEAICAQRQGGSVPLIFDAAHGFGSLHEGQPVGQAGWCQVYSLTPTKMVVAGEGGVVATNDDDLAAQLRIAREYGNDGSYDSTMAGLNARLSELHCVLARESLKMLEEVVAWRNKSACQLHGALSAVPGVSFQSITPHSRTTYKDFTIAIDPELFGCSRDAMAWALGLEGVPSRAYFSPACHLHTAYRSFQRRPLPRTERLAARCLSIPLLGGDTVLPMAEALARIQRHAGEVEKAHGAFVGG